MIQKAFILSLAIILCSCTSNKDFTTDSSDKSIHHENASIELESSTVDLTMHLRKFSGVQVLGEGANAKIGIRGVNSFSARTEPLIVLDGAVVSNYFELYNSVSVSSIKRVEVLKNPAELALYGVRGSNGVIVVTTRKS